MSFISELERLKEKATKGPWTVGEYDETAGYDCMTGGIEVGPITIDGMDYGQKPCDEISIESLEKMQSDAKLIALLVNHADEIAELVKAAEKVTRHSGSAHRAVEQSGLRDSLANLNKEKS